MLIIKAGFEHGRCFCYFPTPLEPSPCDSPPLHPGKLSAWAAANKNSPVRGKWGPASAPLLWWEDTSLCISSSPPNHIICKWGEQDRSVGRGQPKRKRQIWITEISNTGEGREGEGTGGGWEEKRREERVKTRQDKTSNNGSETL